jgi:hypothetical protein
MLVPAVPRCLYRPRMWRIYSLGNLRSAHQVLLYGVQAYVRTDRFKEQRIQEVYMKRIDPATDLAERSIRQWQISESKAARHDLAKKHKY